MGVRWYSIVIDWADVHAQAHWWARALGWVVAFEAEDEAAVVPPRAMSGKDIPLDEQGPGLVFVAVPDGKTGKNRLHIDLAPGPDDDQAAEVTRLEGLGAKRVDIGQGDAPWVVLADPEGNEFCVLTARG
jgi:glyoxalase superfamily protein